MRILRISSIYHEYKNKMLMLSKLYGMEFWPFKQIETHFFSDRFACSDVWAYVLDKRGIPCEEVISNFEPLALAWCRDKDKSFQSCEHYVISRTLEFKPTIVWFDDLNLPLLQRLKETLPKETLYLGWSGSAIFKSEIWKGFDAVLSCAQESVDYFNSNGVLSFQIHHAFDSRVSEQIVDEETDDRFAFFGQLIRGSEFHLNRERMLIDLLNEFDLAIYSPSYFDRNYRELRNLIKSIVRRHKYNRLVNPSLRPKLLPPLFGIDMYKAAKRHRGILNFHADSSPLYASNMRLFETTGVGGLLVTDFKKNIGELFKPNEEVIVFNGLSSLKEKLNWIKENPKDAEVIKKNGQRKTLEKHTFENRVDNFLEIIHNKKLNQK